MKVFRIWTELISALKHEEKTIEKEW
jgi:hypothetical protein